MSARLPGRALRPGRVRAARSRLLSEPAVSLADHVRPVFCEPTRAQMVRALSVGPLTVTDLATVLVRSRSATSQHLRVLREVGIVSRTRRGRAVFYALTADPVALATLSALDVIARAAS
jgi:ArsR family transcriptional regulator, lead/cadmium/zinc/bismuth-responsive transcriptional repressor